MTTSTEEPFTAQGEVSPLTISIMFACYVSSNPREALGFGRWESPAAGHARIWLRDQFLIDDDNRATERGKAWIRFICQTPLPEQAWRLPDRTMGNAA